MFLGFWSRWRRLSWLLWMAGSFLLFSIAILLQILHFPQDNGQNAVISCMFYAMATVLFADATLRRLQLRPNYLLNFGAAAAIVAATAWFYYGQRNLDARVYVMNFGFGLLLLVAALRIAKTVRGAIDRTLFWVLLIFALQFFPRTLLTVGYVGSHPDRDMVVRSPFWIWLNFSFILFTVALGLVYAIAVVSDIVAILHRNANTDPLTGLYNRRGFREFAEGRALKRARLRCVIVLDIDNFKSVNDVYGHDAGDRVLTQVAAVLSSNIRATDGAARLGGEEFAVLLAHPGRNEVFALAERLRNEIACTQFGSGELLERTITASFGVVEAEAGEALEESIRAADELLYVAKRNGKNQTVAGWLRDDAVGVDAMQGASEGM